ncbi:MAG: sugar ABC transporter permease [Clostridia bacterium]|nr:sugar ABC transporter permease [Clostridia bacterium]
MRLRSDTRHKLEGYIFILPFIVGFFLFFLSPLIRSITLSVSDVTKMVGLSDMTLVGFKHYVYAFTGDVEFIPKFLQVITDTLVNTPMILVFSFILAIMLSRNIRCRGFFRVVFFLPFLLGSGYVMSVLLDLGLDQMAVSGAKDLLLTDEIKELVGPGVVNVVDEFFSRISTVLWKSGVQIIIFLSGLQSISPALYEAARVDAATEWDIFWKITLPMMTPIIFLNIVYTIVDSFGDVNNAMINYFTDKCFSENQVCYAAALSWIYFLFVAVLLGLVFLFMNRIVNRTVGQG